MKMKCQQLWRWKCIGWTDKLDGENALFSWKAYRNIYTGLVGYNDTAYSDKPFLVTLKAFPKWLVC